MIDLESVRARRKKCPCHLVVGAKSLDDPELLRAISSMIQVGGELCGACKALCAVLADSACRCCRAMDAARSIHDPLLEAAVIATFTAGEELCRYCVAKADVLEMADLQRERGTAESLARAERLTQFAQASRYYAPEAFRIAARSILAA